MPTPTSKRKQPQRRFEEYIFTRITSSEVGLTDIPTTMFTKVPGTVGDGYTLEAVSGQIPLGFDFSFDGITYKSFVAATSGWIALVDPSTGTFAVADIITGGNNFTNSAVKSTFIGKPVLLAPWFDDQINVTNNLTDLGGAMTAARILRIQQGLEAPPVEFSLIDYGVKYFYDVRSPRGRRTIVRWSSITSAGAFASSVIRYEVVLYENGWIEFRYGPKNGLIFSSTSEHAVIGIFMPTGTNRFRDLSLGLGYRDIERQQYRHGGVEYSTGYTDTNTWATAAYSCNLKPDQHWPGLNSAGTIFTFMPPPARRKVLPRGSLRDSDSTISMPLVARTGDDRLGTYLSAYDDRKSVAFVSNVIGVNYPSTLPRFYADSEAGIVSRQDMFTGDFELTASIVKSAVDSLIVTPQTERMKPFNEVSQPEQDSGTFFASGTLVNDVGPGLTSALKSKTQIRLSFPVKLSTQTLALTSSIFYYNKTIGQFQNIPVTHDAATTTGKSDFGNAIYEAGTLFKEVIETARGFTAWGSAIVSGSGPVGVSLQTNANMGREYTQINETEALTDNYPKSVTKNADYDASNDQCIILPITQPFLIEKAVVEIPMNAGDGWFQDITESFLEITANASVDVGGPGITVTLMNQITNETGYYRDIIMTGTITHSRDNFSDVVLSNFPQYATWDNPLIGTVFQLRPRGFLSLATPSAIITPVSSSIVGFNFTGSVKIQMEAAISNGVTLKYTQIGGSSPPPQRDLITQLLTSPTIVPRTTQTSGINTLIDIAYIDAMGRAQTGFEPSGRSLYGKEFITSQNVLRFGTVKNPFYVSSSFSQLPTQMQEALTTGTDYIACGTIPLGSSVPSPYLVFPGDKLVLGIAKTRPHLFMASGTAGGFKHFSSSVGQTVGHDISIATGTINITLYGSLLRGNSEFHDTMNQPLASDAVHEIFVGSDPVLDQFDVNYRGTYFGSMNDDFITGSMLTVSKDAAGLPIFVTGSRGRVFSKLRSRVQAMPSQAPTSYEAQTNPSLAFRSQPWYELVGGQRTVQVSSLSERFYDSMMPSINSCFNADGTGIFRVTKGTGWPGSLDSVTSSDVGWIFFDDPLITNLFSNKNWAKAYPFEPRYSAVPRQTSIEKSFIVDYQYDGQSNITTPIVPVPVSGFFFVFSGLVDAPGINFFGATDAKYGYRIGCDINIRDTFPGGFAITGSANAVDITKAMYGFGDVNNMQFTGTVHESGITLGSNHNCDFHSYAWTPSLNAPKANVWGLAPIIRGWKYGVYSGLPAYSKCTYRRDRFGQLRDMLEQRLFTKYYTSDADSDGKPGLQQSPVIVKFVDFTGKLTKPENTWSQNLSFEVTSSVPYVDGISTNRPAINVAALNASLISITTDALGNVTL